MSFAGAFRGPNPTRPFLLSTRGMSLSCFLLSVFLKRGTWDTFCMVTLLEDATSLYNKYLLSVFYNLAHFLYPLCRFPRAVLYLPYRVLVCVFTFLPFRCEFSFSFLSFFFINVCLLDLHLGYTVVPLELRAEGLFCFLFFCFSFSFLLYLMSTCGMTLK